jgi:hypothetical protein
MLTTWMITSCEIVVDGPDPGRFLIVDPPPRPDAGPDGLPPPPPPPLPPPPCVEDASEPNDEQAAATASTSGVPQLGQACADNADWFSINVATGCVVRYEVAVDEGDYARGGDVDAVLVDAQGAVLSASAGLSRVDTGAFVVQQTKIPVTSCALTSTAMPMPAPAMTPARTMTP